MKISPTPDMQLPELIAYYEELELRSELAASRAEMDSAFRDLILYSEQTAAVYAQMNSSFSK